MEIKVNMNLGNVGYQFNIEEKSEIDALHKAIILGNVPRYCQECKNKEYFKLDTNKDKDGHTYINCMCTNCGAKAKLGQYTTGGFFWHKFVKYVKPGGETVVKDEKINWEE